MSEINPETIKPENTESLNGIDRLRSAIDLGRNTIRFFVHDLFPSLPSKKELKKREEERRWRMSGGYRYLTMEDMEAKRQKIIRNSRQYN